MPLAWKTLKGTPSEGQLARLNDANENVLNTVTSLEGVNPEYVDESAPLSQELAHIDFKLNLLLDMVSQLLSARTTIPNKVNVLFGARAVEWAAGPLPKTGDWVVVDLYLHPGYPRPLRVAGCAESGAEADAVKVPFHGLSTPIQESLEKIIFRHHRRQVAQARTQHR